jgi:hypothetical protein
MRSYYVLWHCLKYTSHICIYYNTTFNQSMWINGRGLNQIEYIVPPVSGVTLGIDGTGHRQLIHTKLLLIKYIVLEFPK